ncbi:MAG: disulfide bond formation protein B [Paracoccaceae bacterium]|nr:disulfide bond formation protein B [Paracoccaceae bacterium]
MTPKGLTLLAAGGSAALLLGAFAFQAAGFAPCQLCLWQRWPHGVAIAAGLMALSGVAVALWALAGALAALTTAGIGLYHTGVERGVWEGPQACSGGGSLAGLSGADLLSTEGASDVVRCDEVVWALAGLSMASWNALLSLALAALWAVALVRARTG